MATLRLFAGLKEAAGSARVELPGDTVADVLEAAVDRFGTAFADRLPRARVWVNGEEADPDDPVASGDEVALIPPVSGGAGTIRAIGAPVEPVALVTLGVVLVAANAIDGIVWWATAVVLLTALWAIDVAMTVTVGGREVPILPPLVTVIGSLVAVYLLGAPGLGLVVAVAVATTLGWAVASESSRMLPILAPSFLLALVSGAAVGSLVLVRTAFVPPTGATSVFVVTAIAATTVGVVIERFSHLPFGDPFSATALTAVVASLVAASIWNLDLVAFLVAGIVMAVSLIAGRGMGSILRTRTVSLVERAPGYLSAVDGVVLAAALYYPILRLAA